MQQEPHATAAKAAQTTPAMRHLPGLPEHPSYVSVARPASVEHRHPLRRPARFWKVELPPSLPALALAILSTILMVGCRTGEPGSASFASVVISGHTPEEICQTAAKVFQEDGYAVGSLDPAAMVFQKEGSRGQSLAYGGVVDTHYGATTAVRVRASLVDLGGGKYRLQGQAYMVRNANDSFFQDETAILHIRRRPYQNLFDEVAKRLK